MNCRQIISVKAHVGRRTTLCRNYNDLRFLKQFA